VMNTAEKPYEDEKESKIIKNAEEVARWDERKKWQKKMEEAKQRLKEADLEVSKLSKQNTGLRETVQRQEREKMLQEAKWKGHLKVGGLKTKVEDGKQDLLQMENNQLRDEVKVLQEELNKVDKSQEPGNETLKLRVKFLQGRVEQQEKKISMLELGKKAGTTGLYKEIENLRKKEASQEKERSKVDEESVELKVKVASMEHNMAVLAEVVVRLDGLAEMLVSKCGDLTLVENLQKAVGVVREVVTSTGGGNVRKMAGSPVKSMVGVSGQERRFSEVVEGLREELSQAQVSNNQLLEALEVKERRVKEVEIMLREASSSDKEKMGGEEVSTMRQMEVDLARKSDLLSEVKGLLRQAADREREQEKEKESLKRQLKLILEIDPKTPGEALAKELRQVRLTVERLTCEKKELEHQLFTNQPK